MEHEERVLGAASIAGLDSLVATCEARGINPFEYLVDVLTRVQDCPIGAIDELLPGGWAAARDGAYGACRTEAVCKASLAS